MTDPNLIVDEANGDSNLGTIGLDPVLASYKSSTPRYNDDNPRKTVLVPLVGGGGERYLLGPSELNRTIIASAQAAFQTQNWVVDVTLTGPGALAFDTMANKYFHEIIGIDLDGRVVSAPLTQPAQSTFTSFAGRVQISGSFTRQSAEGLAADLDSGPLAVPLQVRQ